MKCFTFPLERVLAWRHAQARVEEAKLSPLLAQVAKLEQNLQDLAGQGVEAAQFVRQAEKTMGRDLACLDRFEKSIKTSRSLARAALQQAHVILARQQQTVLLRQRDAQLLSKLRARRMKEWSAGVDQEIEQQAQELFLTRWRG